TELPFNEENALVVTGLQQSISKVIDERNAANTSLANTRNDLKEAETQIAELMSAGQEGRDILRKEYEQKLALSSKQRKAMERAEREQKARFEKVQSMFDASEANVYQQRQNVLISVHGFKFPTGRSEIDAVNFPLLNKITKSIKIFPNSRIQVGGHTDATGDDSFNQRLSQQRARKVARFLSEVGNISADRIVAYGFGESRPVASNETADGRAANRRVDIIIFNE
ncbi:OmpA family protein, partial [Kaarinaea lacus]